MNCCGCISWHPRCLRRSEYARVWPRLRRELDAGALVATARGARACGMNRKSDNTDQQGREGERLPTITGGGEGDKADRLGSEAGLTNQAKLICAMTKCTLEHGSIRWRLAAADLQFPTRSMLEHALEHGSTKRSLAAADMYSCFAAAGV
eukprot:scaffold180736_cov17-Tisochrysis_lutea.AAC.1